MSGREAVAPKVLVVDDQSDNLTVISLALQEQGYRVSTAVNGRDAVGVARLVLPQLILMDISMPVLDGIGATRAIRGEDKIKDVPIVMLTALDDDQFRREAAEAGADGYFTKPVDFPRLQAFMDKLLRGASGEEREAKPESVISPDTGRLDPRFVLWRMFCAANDVPVETLPSELGAELNRRWQLLKKEKRPLFRF
ncbi:MAG TPA: response regulator [Pyrinomonadaceae bacterium]|nr:response regulator [Pyrinomonadaceae bacterium]